MVDFKNINIGRFIELRWIELNVSIERTCNFFGLSEAEIFEVFKSESIDSAQLLRWCKLLEYDFFRLYSQHLVLYSPSRLTVSNKNNELSNLPVFRKNLYTPEIISFIMELLTKGEKNKKQIMDEYRIPKTTLHKWINKYADNKY